MLAAVTPLVGAEYFQLPVADADAVYRERPYCYELYHQLQSAWGDFPFSLGGEIDKVGHPHFEDGPYARVKPDFLVHVPGTMDGNLAAVEVKPGTADIGDLRHDISKLVWFCQNARYHKGVLLVYGEAGDTNALRRKLVAAANGVEYPQVMSLYHHHVGQPAEPLPVNAPREAPRAGQELGARQE